MAKTVFTNGSVVTAEFLNSIQEIKFDDQPADGHYPKISNEDLSDAAGQIKPEWLSFRDALKVSAATGLTVTYQSGALVLPTGAIATISPGAVALASNAINYIFVNSAGQVVASTVLPVSALMLAKVTTVNNAISGAVEDLRPRFMVLPQARAIKIFGGSGDQGVYSLSGTATFDQGEYYFSSFTVQAGATLTIDKSAKILVSGNVNIAGTITVTSAVDGGSNYATQAQGNLGGMSGAGPGAGNGSGAGPTYNYVLVPHGSGGGTGFTNNSASSSSAPGSGGRGGGGLTIEAGGSISIAGNVNARGGNGGNATVFNGTALVSGGGGGSGGLILLKSLLSVTISSTATVDVRGGNGGNGDNGAGGGGGGGQLVLVSPNNNTTGATVLLSGGIRGASTNTNLGGGSGGSFGGAGGVGANGGTGQMIIRNFIPVG